MPDKPFMNVINGGIISNCGEKSSCNCETAVHFKNTVETENRSGFYKSGCLYCGADIVYTDESTETACFVCKELKQVNAKCLNGHFICDRCHARDFEEMVEKICLVSEETEMIPLFERIRNHPHVPLNGPEHHFIIPGVITSVYRNLGGKISANDIKTAVRRGKDVPGGACGFWGICGATIGSGIALSIILSGSPLTPGPRKEVQQAVSEIARTVSGIQSARCCRRESLTVLFKVAEMSEKMLPVKLKAGKPNTCNQFRHNKECPGKKCKFFPEGAVLSPFMELPGEFNREK